MTALTILIFLGKSYTSDKGSCSIVLFSGSPEEIRIVFSAILRWVVSCDSINQQNCPKFNLERPSQDETDGKCRKQTEFAGV